MIYLCSHTRVVPCRPLGSAAGLAVFQVSVKDSTLSARICACIGVLALALLHLRQKIHRRRNTTCLRILVAEVIESIQLVPSGLAPQLIFQPPCLSFVSKDGSR